MGVSGKKNRVYSEERMGFQMSLPAAAIYSIGSSLVKRRNRASRVTARFGDVTRGERG